jgi:hypothetical protein
VYHDRLRASHLLLPVIPAGDVAAPRAVPPRDVPPAALRQPAGRPF